MLRRAVGRRLIPAGILGSPRIMSLGNKRPSPLTKYFDGIMAAHAIIRLSLILEARSAVLSFLGTVLNFVAIIRRLDFT